MGTIEQEQRDEGNARPLGGKEFEHECKKPGGEVLSRESEPARLRRLAQIGSRPCNLGFKVGPAPRQAQFVLGITVRFLMRPPGRFDTSKIVVREKL